MTITKLVYHPITILIVTLIAIMFFFSLNKSSKKVKTSAENIKILEKEVNQISEELIELEKEIDKTESDQFKEKIIRNELLMKKPGEYVLQIPNKEPNLEKLTTENNSKREAHNFSKWKKLIL